MELMQRRRELMAMQGIRITLYYGYGLPRYSTETDYDVNAKRCSTSAIYVTTGDLIRIIVPNGFYAALGVWNKDRTYAGGYQPELYGGWNENLSYTVQNVNCFARIVYRTAPTENVFQGNELNGKVKIYVNKTLYYA